MTRPKTYRYIAKIKEFQVISLQAIIVINLLTI